MKKLAQKGFSHIEILLVVVLVVLVGGIGYYVYSQSQKQDDTSKPQSNVSGTLKDKPAADTTTPASTQKYLNITELGVKMPVSGVIADAYYHLENGYAYLSVESLKNVEQCAADKVSIGVLSKNSVSDPVEQSPSGQTYGQAAQEGPGTVIGNVAYYYTQPQANCYDNPTTEGNAKQEQIMQAFKGASKKLEAL